MPGYYRRNVAVNAVRKAQNHQKTVDENREAIGRVVTYCVIIALHDRFGIGKDRMENLGTAINRAAQKHETLCRVKGYDRAKKELVQETQRVMPQGFVLPAGKMPKTGKEREALVARREAAETTVRLLVSAVVEHLWFGEKRIGALLKETEVNYRQFLDWASEGDAYGYTLIARKMEQITGDKIQVVEEEGKAPVFAKTYY